jgi:hypothetical protein
MQGSQPRKDDGRFDRKPRKRRIDAPDAEGANTNAVASLNKKVESIVLARHAAFNEYAEKFGDIISGTASIEDVLRVIKSKNSPVVARCACAVYPEDEVLNLALQDDHMAVRVTALLDNPICSPSTKADSTKDYPETMLMAICTKSADNAEKASAAL